MNTEENILISDNENYCDRFFYSDSGAPYDECVFRSGEVRVTVLTPSLVRVEKCKSRLFCDEPTQSVMNRRFEKPVFTAAEKGKEIIIKTDKCVFSISASSGKAKTVTLPDGRKVGDFKSGNLGGTIRTLDNKSGKAKLGDGILSKNGAAVLDDSASLKVLNDGTVLPRENAETDLYYFAYGRDYEGALYDYFRLTGFPPLVPRYVLGNWWSRYHAYTQDEYIALMDKFAAKKIPLTVATIDMDWHWVKVTEKFGDEAREQNHKRNIAERFFNIISPGWTGYSWNTDLFPAPDKFLKDLKAKNLGISMNLHPASGCRFYEDSYKDFCEFMGIDPESRQQIFFDITDKKFIEGYFRFLHHPHEDAGVDFWWIDWQQGSKTKIPGLDPLWALNHYHYLDNARDNKRPMILSRFAGAGSHRYPLGFSGDSSQTWSMLDFQPYFTATASNIGYTWWSHDIGGHHRGRRDDELYLRWVQFAVFSPILRLHSTASEFMGKEPWKYRADVEHYASEAMRFRHRLIPYIYSMNRITATEGKPLMRPVYYLYPDDERAYNAPNEYFFGTELIACPVTEKINPEIGLAGAKVFLPEGRYTDIFTGRIYSGNRTVTLYRDEASIPVLAKEGAIIPLAANGEDNSTANPDSLEILIYRGSNSFKLYEDDGISENYKNGAYCETVFTVKENGDSLSFVISAPSGDTSVIPQSRKFRLLFKDIVSAAVRVKAPSQNYSYEMTDGGCLAVAVEDVSPADSVTVELEDIKALENESREELIIETISKLQASNAAKLRFNAVIKGKKVSKRSPLYGPLAEIDALYYGK